MSLRTDLIPAVDAARGILDDLGLRARPVVVRTVTRGATGIASLTTAPEVSDLTLTPTPRVTGQADRVARHGGRFEQGDVLVDKISLTYTREQLDPGGNSVWLVDGAEYRLANLAGPEKGQQFEWVALLRRVRHEGATPE